MKKKNKRFFSQPWWPRSVKNQGIENLWRERLIDKADRLQQPLTEKELFAIAAKNKKETT